MPMIGMSAALRKTERALKIRLALRLVRCVLAREVRRDLRVSRRIPFLDVDSVGDALEAVAHRREHRVKSESSVGRSQLFGVARADCDSVVAEGEATFQEVDLSVPLELVEVERLRRNSEVADDCRGEVSLVSGVVNGEDCAGSLKALPQVAVRSHVHECERRVPVVRVHSSGPLTILEIASSAARAKSAKRRGLSG